MPRPARLPKPPERDVQRACVATLERLGCRVHRRNSGAVTGEHKGKTRVIRYGEKGAADLFGVLPNGVHFETEIKRDGERPELHQVNWLREANRYSPAFWVDGAEQLDVIVPAILSGARIVWGSGTEMYRVEMKMPDGKKVAHWVSGPTSDFHLEYPKR